MVKKHIEREVKFADISIELIDKMGSDKRVTNVARTSFNRWLDEDEPLSEKDIGLLHYLATGLPASEREDWENRAKASIHWAPFAHCFLTLRCKVPIFLARQLGKHQIGLVWSEESRRYISDNVELWIPNEIHKAPENAKQGASAELHAQTIDCRELDHSWSNAKDAIKGMTWASVWDYYQLVDKGVAPEEARIVLPQNAMVNYIWSGSLLAFYRVYKQRIDAHAQKAGAQEFADKLGKILFAEFPESMLALTH